VSSGIDPNQWAHHAPRDPRRDPLNVTMRGWTMQRVKKAAHTLGIHGPYWWELNRRELGEYVARYWTADDIERVVEQLRREDAA
jgi:hypothetical protein